RRRVSTQFVPTSGTRPIRPNAVTSRASRTEAIRSQLSAHASATPAASPFSAAMNTLSLCDQARDAAALRADPVPEPPRSLVALGVRVRALDHEAPVAADGEERPLRGQHDRAHLVIGDGLFQRAAQLYAEWSTQRVVVIGIGEPYDDDLRAWPLDLDERARA